jgi:hypothetical protein
LPKREGFAGSFFSVSTFSDVLVSSLGAFVLPSGSLIDASAF